LRLDVFSRINTYKIDTGASVGFLVYYLLLRLSMYPYRLFITDIN